ncbi:MAG: hypothetical protein AAFW46_08610 [Pseudomonadota bacterium]
MLMDRLGQCRFCEYEPIADNAKFCPRCGATNPYRSDFPWVSLSLVLLLLIAGGGAYLYFASGLF